MGFIAVVGQSGVGKTVIIDKLIKMYPVEYKRAKSYTTRAKRNECESEYHFISCQEMDELLKKGIIKYVDYAFGSMYAMDVSVFNENRADVIKEIHPSNIYKIKEYTSNLITISILPCEDLICDGRARQDDYNYSCFDADIVLYNNGKQNIDELAVDLHRKICAYKLQKEMGLPSFKEIDIINKKGYDLIASEFNDEKRITTANFHEASEKFFIKEFLKFNGSERILEVGSGNGWLAKLLDYDFQSIDISDKMCCKNLKRTASASLIPCASNSCDIVFASLCDPFFYPVSIAEMIRILTPNGKLIMSLPSYEWARINRNGDMKTTFVNSRGDSASVYSFIFNKEQISLLGERIGFGIIKSKSYTICNSKNIISDAILIPCAAAKLDYKRLPIVDCYVLKKEKL